ncbi:hypothetical protein M0802_009178 [Mischocyttarus mexicanus]|nr:hypothetical protein M0802_009178 [Mischocyttarus mexicanus]
MGLGEVDKKSKHWRTWEPLDVEAAVLAVLVAVMAPALTEDGPQKPENLLPSLSALGFLSPEQATKVCRDREILAKFVVSANVQPSKIDEQYLHGVSKDLIRYVINSNYANSLDNLSTYSQSSDLILKEIFTEQDCKRPVTPDSPKRKETDTIMNDPSMGDQADNMGFLKTNDDLSLVESATAEGDNKNLDVDQIMAFGTEINTDNEQCNISTVGDIGQNILPYEPRVFPLSEEVYDKMVEVMPDGHWQTSSVSLCSRDEEKDDDGELESPESDSTESACCDIEGEDPNDPEWTVADNRDTEKERIRPTAKR